ncbi:MAG TPA: protein kinase [Ktedonobacterales bacterium]
MDTDPRGPASLVGQHLAGYELERLLGTGATGAVFLGRRLDSTPHVLERAGELPILLPEQVALKVLIPPWQFTDEQRAAFRARFTREAQTLERLHHPHILSLLASGEDRERDLTYLLLPYLSGGTLAQRLRTVPGPLAYPEVAEMLIQLAEALDYAHAQGVIHRDIKPANILRDEAGQLYLSDFGIVRLLSEAQTHLTASGVVLGTPEYMAPEQLDGVAVGPAADTYSLGMVLYELVTGKVAFQANTLTDLFRRQLFEVPPRPSALRTDLPAPAEAAIYRALAKQPDQRFRTAQELAQSFILGLRDQWTPGLTLFAPPVFTEPPGVPTVPLSEAMGTSLPPYAPSGNPSLPPQTPAPMIGQPAPPAQRVRSGPWTVPRPSAGPAVVMPGMTPPNGLSPAAGGQNPPLSPVAWGKGSLPISKRMLYGGLAALVVLAALAGTLALLHRGSTPGSVPSTVTGTMGHMAVFKHILVGPLPQLAGTVPEAAVPIQLRQSADSSASLDAAARHVSGLPAVAASKGITLSTASSQASPIQRHLAGLGQDELHDAAPAGVSVAANDQYVVEAVGGALLVATSSSARRLSLAALFQQPYHSGATFGESRVLLDAGSSRWILVANEVLAPSGDAVHSYFDLAISESSNPFGGWYIFQLDTGALRHGCTWADYPQLGLNQVGIFITGTSFACGRGGALQGADVWMLPRVTFESGKASAVAQWVGFQNAQGAPLVTVTPAVEVGHTTELLMSNDAGYVDNGRTSRQLYLWGVQAPTSAAQLTSPPRVFAATVTLTAPYAPPYADPPRAQQPGTSTPRIPAGDARITGLVYSGNQVFATFTTAVNWSGDGETRSGVYWVELAPTFSTQSGTSALSFQGVTILSEELIGQRGTYFFAPSFTIAADGSVKLAAEASGSALHASPIYASEGIAQSGPTFGSAVMLAAGQHTLAEPSWMYLTGASLASTASEVWMAATTTGSSGGSWQTSLWSVK